MTLLRRGGWTRWPTEVPSNPYYSVILWFKMKNPTPVSILLLLILMWTFVPTLSVFTKISAFLKSRILQLELTRWPQQKERSVPSQCWGSTATPNPATLSQEGCFRSSSDLGCSTTLLGTCRDRYGPQPTRTRLQRARQTTATCQCLLDSLPSHQDLTCLTETHIPAPIASSPHLQWQAKHWQKQQLIFVSSLLYEI